MGGKPSTAPPRGASAAPTRSEHEAHSKTFHDQMLARADDITKATVFEALGYTVIRTSWAEATSRPDRMISRVREALSAGRAG